MYILCDKITDACIKTTEQQLGYRTSIQLHT